MKLSPHEAAWIALQVGFINDPCRDLPAGVVATEVEMFVAVTCGESGLDTEVMARSTDATSPHLGNRDHGLAQVSGRWQWDKIQAVGGRWRDPLVNAGIAYQIFLTASKPDPADASKTVPAPRTFWPWSVFKSGAFRAYLPDARIAAAHPWPWVDPVAALIAERDRARADLAGFQKQAADAIAELNATNNRISVLTSANLDLAARLNAANAKLDKARTDLA